MACYLLEGFVVWKENKL